MNEEQREITYAQAITEATDQAMQLDPSVFVVGQGTRDRGCVFGTLTGLYEKYGEKRVIEMPLSEPSITGMCIGAAMNGMRPVLVLQRADFAFLAMDQLINHASKWHFMFGGAGAVPLTVRLIVGKGWGQGPQHSQSLYSTFAHFPGFRVVVPTTPADAKGLLLNSIFSDDPVIFIEGRPLHNLSGAVSPEPYTLPFGHARVRREGRDITIIASSFLVPEAIRAAESLAARGISAEVIDVISVSPLDKETILNSVGKTGRVLIADCDWAPFGLASEISSLVSEQLFGRLKAPPARLCFPFVSSPAAYSLEKEFYFDAAKIIESARQLF